jgi:hypothetical protein
VCARRRAAEAFGVGLGQLDGGDQEAVGRKHRADRKRVGTDDPRRTLGEQCQAPDEREGAFGGTEGRGGGGQFVPAALRQDFLARLDRRDGATGLNDAPHVPAVRRLLRETPALAQRAVRRLLAGESAETVHPAARAAAEAAFALAAGAATDLTR